MTTVLVVDDEPPARRKLLAHLAGFDGAQVIAEAGNGLEAVDAIRARSPEVVFLDIQMPGMDGFEVVEAVGVDAMPATVFVTAHDDFAVNAFDVEAVDYVLKPYTGERLRKAWERARSRLGAAEAERERLRRLLAEVRPAARHLTRLVVRKGERLFFVNVAEIQRLTADGNYVQVVTPGGTYQLRETLAHLESRLDPERFARIHRSEIVNVEAIAELQPFFHGDYVVVMKDGTQLRLSRRYSDRLLKE